MVQSPNGIPYTLKKERKTRKLTGAKYWICHLVQIRIHSKPIKSIQNENLPFTPAKGRYMNALYVSDYIIEQVRFLQQVFSDKMAGLISAICSKVLQAAPKRGGGSGSVASTLLWIIKKWP
jgi:hypothetical protein